MRAHASAAILALLVAGCGSDPQSQGGETDDGSTAATSTSGTDDSTTTELPTTSGSTSGGQESSSTGADASTSGDIDCATPLECAALAEQRAADRLEEVREDDGPLQDFLTAMPLGGDLHHHLSGSVYAETYLAWAEADGDFCITESSLALSLSCGDGNDEIGRAHV